MCAKIVIDAGHGGQDGGAGSGRYLEKNLVLDVSRKLRAYLQNNFSNVTIYMTRDSDIFRTLSYRSTYANNLGADYFISVHFNAFNGTASGYEDYIHTPLTNTSKTARIRDAIHSEVVNRVIKPYGIKNRGKKKANFSVIRNTRMSAILVEVLFCDSRTDQRFIDNANVMNAFVTAFGEGIAKGLGLTRKSSSPRPSTSPTTSQPSTQVLYRVQNGAYSSYANAQNMLNRLKASGYNGYILQEGGLYKVQTGAFSSRANALKFSEAQKQKGFSSFIYQST